MSYYLPQPPRAWSRVQGIPYCTNPLSNTNATVYVPRTNQTLTLLEGQLLDKMINKGNILQYKNNSSNLTKSQKYSLISKGAWVSKKSYATQTQTYTNPNTSSLYRANSETISPNTLIGFPNNEAGPYQYGVPNPFNCNSIDIVDGGSLIINKIVQPCTNEVLKTCPPSYNKCFPITASNVPGFSNPSVTRTLCWDSRIDTWYPKPRLNMNNSGNKWPINYKAFVSACKSSAV